MTATIIVSAALAAAVFFAIRSMIKAKKQGKSSCGCGCSGCAMSSMCRKNEQK